MDSTLHVGNKVDKETATNLAEIVKTIFEVGRKTGMDQSTIVDAIQMVGTVAEVKNVTITHSNFNGDKVINMDSVGD